MRETAAALGAARAELAHLRGEVDHYVQDHFVQTVSARQPESEPQPTAGIQTHSYRAESEGTEDTEPPSPLSTVGVEPPSPLSALAGGWEPAATNGEISGVRSEPVHDAGESNGDGNGHGSAAAAAAAATTDTLTGAGATASAAASLLAPAAESPAPPPAPPAAAPPAVAAPPPAVDSHHDHALVDASLTESSTYSTAARPTSINGEWVEEVEPGQG